MMVPTWVGTKMADATKTSVTEFWYKSVNLSLEELINIKLILFLMIDRKIPRNTSFFYPHDSFLGRHVKPRHAKA